MPRLTRAMMAALCCVLAAPAAAGAATLTVDPADDGQCNRTSDTVCKTISAAVGAAQPKDTIQVKEGTYAEAVAIPSDKSELLISGTGDVAKTRLTGPSGGGDTLTISAERTTVSGLAVLSAPTGSSAVVIGAANALLKGVILQRADATETADPVVQVTAGPATLEQAFVVQNAGPATAPAVVSAAAGGLKLLDSLIVSAKGDALALTAGADNLVQRTQLLAPVGAANALAVTSAANSSAAKKVTLDSTVLSGGAASGTGLLARTAGSGTPVPSSTAGDITVIGRHLTVAGARNGVVLDASAANGSPVAQSGAGNITGTFTASILHGASRADKFEGSQLTGASNTATLNCTACDGPKATGDGTITGLDGSSNTEDAKLFRRNSFLLRADAPVIDKGGALTSGESAKDVDQDDRTVGPATDIGADEFRNRPPVAAFGITNAKPKEGEATGFISGSTDPEADSGGSIAKYRWDFGDGQTQETTVPGVAHTYPKRGTYQVKLTVIDNFGAETATAAQTVTVVDGTTPKVTIIAPADGVSLTVTRRVRPAKCRTARTTAKERRKSPRKRTKRVCTKRKVRKAKAVGIAGSVADDAAIQSVEYSLRLLQRSGTRKPSATCEYYASGTSFQTRECSRPLWRPANVQNGLWSAAIAPGLLPPGRYQLRVRATDASGNVTTTFTRDDQTESVFRLK